MKLLSVFIIEDDPIYSCMLEFMIRKLGVDDIFTFASLAEVKHFLQVKPDLILLDYNLEDGESLELLHKIQNLTQESNIIHLSADPSVADKLKAKGLSNFILKDDSAMTNLKKVVKSLQGNDKPRHSSGLNSFLFSFLLCLLTFSSCKNYNMLQTNNAQDYFQEESENEEKDSIDELLVSLENKEIEEPKENINTIPNYILDTDDKLSVSVWNHDDLSVGSVFSQYNSNEVYGKWLLINEQGYINLPQIGKVQLSGLTISEAESLLTKKFDELIKNPIVVVKILNKSITVLGEVKIAGQMILETEKNSLVEVLGRAGGLSDYADSRSLRLIRNEKEYTIDLTKVDAVKLSQVNVMADDMIYVPSQKSKNFVMKSPAMIPVASAITAIVLLLTAFGNK